jgi:hypothetical protein
VHARGQVGRDGRERLWCYVGGRQQARRELVQLGGMARVVGQKALMAGLVLPDGWVGASDDGLGGRPHRRTH